MCGRYTLYTGEQAEEIRQIIDIAQRQVNEQLKLGEVFPSDRAPILVASQDRWWSAQRCGDSLDFGARAF